MVSWGLFFLVQHPFTNIWFVISFICNNFFNVINKQLGSLFNNRNQHRP